MFALAFLLLLASDSPSKLSPLVTAGDEAFFRMDYLAAVETYEQSLAADSTNAEALWRLARVCVCMGEVAEDGEEAKLLFKKAEGSARRCVAVDPSSGEGHTWLAAALGYLALDADIGNQVELSRELDVEIEKALRLNPLNDAAYSIKGSFHRALGNISWFQRQLASLFVGSVPQGGYEEAERALKQAITLAPDIMRHHYELGVLYLDMERTEEAKSVLGHAATLPVKVAIDKVRLKKIAELLREMEGR